MTVSDWSEWLTDWLDLVVTHSTDSETESDSGGVAGLELVVVKSLKSGYTILSDWTTFQSDYYHFQIKKALVLQRVLQPMLYYFFLNFREQNVRNTCKNQT